MDGVTTEFLDINRGMFQGTVLGPLLLGPILFPIMVNDISPLDNNMNLLITYVIEITLSVPGKW